MTEKNIKKRKNQGYNQVKVSGKSIKTYYYDHDQIEEFAEGFECEKVIPVGFFPSYYSANVKKYLNVYKPIFKVEDLFLNLRLFANRADHYLIHLKLN